MTIQRVRTSVLIAVGVAGIAVAGLLAGRLSAKAFPQRAHGDFGERVFARISRALDLTDDQKSKIKDVLRTHADEIRAQIQASAAARSALHDAALAQPSDENVIRGAASATAQTQGDGAVLLAKIRSEVEPILTADQKARIQKFQERMRQHGQNAAQSFDNFLKSSP